MTPNGHGVDGAQGAARYTVGPMNPNIGSIMQARPFDSDSLTQRLKDRQVAQAVVNGSQQLTIQFSDGTTLIVEARSDGLLTHVESAGKSATQDTSQHPTQRHPSFWQSARRAGHRAALPCLRADCEPNDANARAARFNHKAAWCAAIHSNLHRSHRPGHTWPRAVKTSQTQVACGPGTKRSQRPHTTETKESELLDPILFELPRRQERQDEIAGAAPGVRSSG